MQEKAKEPEIRFAGFTGAWEQRKAKDLFAAYSDKGHPDLDVLIICQNNFRHSFSLTWSGKTCDIRRSL